MSRLFLKVNDINYEGFTNITVTDSIDQMTGSFNFVATDTDVSSYPFSNNDSCEVNINEIPIITGYIEKILPSYGVDTHNLSIAGRDKTNDIVDSSFYPGIELNSVISLQAIIQTVLDRLGITDIEIIDNVSNLENFKKSELISGENAENAFDFIQKYARKRQVLITSNGEGNIVITRAGTETIPTLLLNEIDGVNNNILEGSARFDNTKRYNKVTVISQSNLSAYDDYSIDNITDNKGIAFDKNADGSSDIRTSRQLVITAETSSDNITAQERAQWEVNVRKANSFTYTCNVQGYTYNAAGDIWQKNKLVFVKDDLLKINEKLLIKTVTYTLDGGQDGGGSKTTLELVKPEAYSLLSSIPENVERSRKTGEEFE